MRECERKREERRGKERKREKTKRHKYRKKPNMVLNQCIFFKI